MCPGLGVGMDGDCACPQFFGAHPCEVNGGLSVHAGCGGHIPVQLIAGNYPDSFVFPFGNIVFVMMVLVICHIGYFTGR